MNWRERFLQITFFVVLFWAANILVGWGLSYFFPGTFQEVPRVQQEQKSVVGTRYEVPTVQYMQQPLIREVDFVDSEVMQELPEESNTVLSGPSLQYEFSSYGGGLSRATYSHQVNGNIVDMQFIEQDLEKVSKNTQFLVALDTPSPYFYAKRAAEAGASFEAATGQARITKKFFSNEENDVIELELTIEPLSETPVKPRLFVTAPYLDGLSDWDRFPGFVLGSGKKMERVYTKKIENSVWAAPEMIGVQDRYFACALINDSNAFAQRGYFWKNAVGRAGFILEGPAINKKTTWRLKFYCGPKESDALAAADSRLEPLMEYGWFAFVARWMLVLLNYFNKHLGGYGWAIILLAFLLNLLLAPFTVKSMIDQDKAAAKQREFSRKQAYIRRRYADDPEQMRQAQMDLIREHGIGGLSGLTFLPFVVQMPFFIALNRVLVNAIQLYRVPFVFWMHDLSQPDPILPWIIGLSMFGMMLFTMQRGKKKLQPTAIFVSLFMLLIMMGVAFKFSTGLSLFLAVGFVFRLVQSFIVKKVQAWKVSHR